MLYNHIVEGGSPKKEDHQIGTTWGATGPIYSSTQAQCNQDNLDIETKEGGLPEEPKKHTPQETLDKPQRPQDWNTRK